MGYLAMFIFGAASSAIGCGVWCMILYRDVIRRFTTEGDGVKIIEFGGRRLAMVEIDG